MEKAFQMAETLSFIGENHDIKKPGNDGIVFQKSQWDVLKFDKKEKKRRILVKEGD